MARGGGLGNPRGFFADYIRRGLSQTKALEAYRADGGGGPNKILRLTYNEVRDSLANYPTISSLPGESVVPAEHHVAWKAGRPGRHAYGVDAFIFDPATDATVKVKWTVMSDDPLSPFEAEQMALDEIEEYQSESETWQGQRTLFTRLRGAYRTV